MGSLDRFEWRSQAALIALVVSRADFSVQRFELPNGGVFHLGTALHRASGRTTLSVFEAAALADGPVAQLALPYGLPLGLHGQFVVH